MTGIDPEGCEDTKQYPIFQFEFLKIRRMQKSDNRLRGDQITGLIDPRMVFSEYVLKRGSLDVVLKIRLQN